MPRATITLAHSPDPDDVFMWWPITGKILPDGRQISAPAIDTGRFEFRPLPADIEELNRRAVDLADLEITALSLRCWADVADRYTITSCGASFGDGFGPKLVCRAGDAAITGVTSAAPADVTIAIPGRKTTAFMLLGLMLGGEAVREPGKCVEMPFDQIIPAVASGKTRAGLVIHEGQLTFAEAGLRLVADTGSWWKARTGLKVPLGVNAVRRDLDSIHGPGSLAEIGGLLRESVKYAADRRAESTAYTMPFAEANAKKSGTQPPTLERVDRYCRMYVSDETIDMGVTGLDAVRRLLEEGAAAGLCPRVGPSLPL